MWRHDGKRYHGFGRFWAVFNPIRHENDTAKTDAWIAASAKLNALTLLHKDPEFEPLKEELDTQELPYKAARRPKW